MTDAGYMLAFVTGLLGGFGHCVGMCGPVVATVTLCAADARGRRMTLSGLLLMNAGRVCTYAFVGSLMGLAGSFVNVAGRIAGVQNSVAILTGISMVFMGIRIAGFLGGGRTDGPVEQFLRRLLRGIAESESPVKYFPIGIVLGFMPCGLSYSVYAGAAGTGEMLSGMVFVLCFGAGTVPALLLVGTVMTILGGRLRGIVYRTSGLVVAATGIYFVARGIIPYAHM